MGPNAKRVNGQAVKICAGGGGGGGGGGRGACMLAKLHPLA